MLSKYIWCGLGIKFKASNYRVEINFNLFDWQLKIDKNTFYGTYLYAVGPFSVEAVNEQIADDWLDSLLKSEQTMENYIHEELYHRGEKQGPDGKPLN